MNRKKTSQRFFQEQSKNVQNDLTFLELELIWYIHNETQFNSLFFIGRGEGWTTGIFCCHGCTTKNGENITAMVDEQPNNDLNDLTFLVLELMSANCQMRNCYARRLVALCMCWWSASEAYQRMCVVSLLACVEQQSTETYLEKVFFSFISRETFEIVDCVQFCK